MQKTYKDIPIYQFINQEEFYAWLGKNYQSDQPFWLRLFKKGVLQKSIDYDQAVRVALCWGWVDVLKNGYDDMSYLMKFTPRKTKSNWSESNINRVEELIAAGLMQPSGMVHYTLFKNKLKRSEDVK